MFRKVIFLVPLFLLTLFCKEIPTGPTDPWTLGGEIEILYERVLPVVTPTDSDPEAATIIHSTKYGGKNSSAFIKIKENTFLATVSLIADGQPYRINLVDPKTLPKLTYKCIARKISLRLKREGAPWVELVCIVPDLCGEAAEFIFWKGSINNPCE